MAPSSSDISAVAPDTVVEETTVTSTVQVPGTPVVTEDDVAASALLAEDPAPAAVQLPVVPAVIDTTSPEANLASRTNIVADGPGTVADFLS